MRNRCLLDLVPDHEALLHVTMALYSDIQCFMIIQVAISDI